MALNVGTTLGSYQVTAKIGEGGMGQVWQATDTQLNRQVALKILPDAFAADPDRLARFKREAKVLASLNHPNIGTIYGLEEAEGTKETRPPVSGISCAPAAATPLQATASVRDRTRMKRTNMTIPSRA